MNRIAIFAPEIKDREEIGDVVENYFKKEFADYFDKIQIPKFYALNEPGTENQIGHQYEILVILDRRLCVREKRSKLSLDKIYYGILKNAVELTKKVCDINDIPYLTYEGEIVKNQEYLFVKKMENIKAKIKKRLEGLIVSD